MPAERVAVAPARAVLPVPLQRGAGPFPRCSTATTLEGACQGLADDLLAAGFDLPSVYLLTGRRLRCHAARGYFQVVDGFEPGTAIIGRTVASGLPAFIPDISAHPEFVDAIPGLVAEACTPVRVRGRVVGAVNVESRSVLPATTADVLAEAAALLGRRLDELGGLPQPSPAQQLARAAVDLTAAASVEELEELAVRAATEVSGMSSAAVVQVLPGGSAVSCATGPLSDALRGLTSDDLAVMSGWVAHGMSSHFPGGETVPEQYAFLRAAGVRALAVHPLVVGGKVHGLLVVADARPVAHAPSVVDLLELLASQTAASLGMAGVLREVSRRAERDELTGLRNRRGFSALLTAELDRARASGAPLAVLLLDLDDFKHVNDSLGHQVGDRVLVRVAEQLRAALRTHDTACRLGGDEFVVVLPGAVEETARAVAQRLLDTLGAVTVDGVELAATASAGVALAGDDDSAESLLRAADLAMYSAKQRGKGRCEVFQPQMQDAAVRRMALTRDLRRAIRDDALALAYQPVVDLRTGALTAVEALVRWHDPERGIVPPSDFVPLAEETGDITALGAWVLRTACRQLLAWDAAGADPRLVVSINVSTRQLERGTLLPLLDACLAEGVDPARLVLEITETALADDSASAEQTLRDLRSRGVGLAVDDFGTGYSSLSRLRSSPVSRLKVDRSFVHEIDDDGDAPIVDATLAMARGLGLGVVAEGVETPAQLAYLRRLGCPEAQGYLLARPLPPDAVLPLLRGHRPWAAFFPAG